MNKSLKQRASKTKVRAGGGGLASKKQNKVNIKLAVPVVLITAAIGGFYIFQKSSASSTESFRIVANEVTMSGGRLVEKTGAPAYRLLDKSNGGWGFFQTTITPSQSNASSELCAHYLGGKGSVNVVVNFTDNTSTNKRYPYLAGAGDACVNITAYKSQGKVAKLLSAWPDLSPAQPTYFMTLDYMFGKK